MPGPLWQASTRLLRWGTVILLVLLLHALAGQWLHRQKIAFTLSTAAKPPIEVLLQARTIQRIATPSHGSQAMSAHARATAAAAPARRQAHEAATLLALAAPASAPVAASTADAASQVAATAGGASGAVTAATANPVLPAPTNAPPSSTAQKGERFALPPAADLRYDTFMNGVQNMPGTISWLTDGDHYDLVVSVPVPFVGKFTYMSHGHVDAFGLAPERYTEQRGSRGTNETRFQRDAKQITFSRTPTVLPLPNGAQDRFSMLFQLASLVRGDPARYTPGVTRAFFVVDDNSGETWSVETLGPESVRIGSGFISALHFTRLPRHAGDRRKIDVWLAPSLGYFPIRIVQTEPNGTQVELLLHDAPHRLDALAANVAGGDAATASGSAANNAPSPGSPAMPHPQEHP